MVKKILHIVPDDIFIDMAIQIYEDVLCENEFVCVVATMPYEMKHIKSTGIVHCMQIDKLLSYINQNDAQVICFHSLTPSMYDIVIRLSSTKKIIWTSWGYDIYYPIGAFPAVISIPLYKPLTQTKISSANNIKFCSTEKTNVKILFNPWKQVTLLKKLYRKKIETIRARHLQSLALRRIDYISTVLPEEFELLGKNPNIQANIYPFRYIHPLSIKQPLMEFAKASYILVGNSGDPSNNHYDILEKLEQLHIPHKRYLPLAYSVSNYTKRLIQDYNGDTNILLQEDFISTKEYKQIISLCKVAIFGHLRQQALGNILILLQQGTKIFFYKESIVYQHFRRNGAFVFSIEDDLCLEAINSPLSNDEINKNRSIAFTTNDYNNMIDLVNATLRTIKTI